MQLQPQLSEVLDALLPQALPALQLRYQLLVAVRAAQLVGRRKLAAWLALPERAIRDACQALCETGLLAATTGGYRLAQQGEDLLDAMAPALPGLFGLQPAANALQQGFAIPQVLLTAVCTPLVPVEIGRLAATALHGLLAGRMVVAITGGPLADALVEAMPPCHLPDVLVLPACCHPAAEHAAAGLAARLGATYRGFAPGAAARATPDPTTGKLLAQADVLVYTANQPPQLTGPQLAALPVRILLAGEPQHAPAVAQCCRQCPPHLLVCDHLTARGMANG